MRIGVDMRYVYPDHVHGIGRYSLELVRAMVTMAPGHEWVAFVREDFAGSATGLAGVAEVRCAEKPVSLGTWFRMPARIRRERLDVFHALFPVLPRGLDEVATVTTFYDLQAVTLSNFSGGRNVLAAAAARAFYRMAYRHAYANADGIVACSRATAQALGDFYGPRKVAVTHASPARREKGVRSLLPAGPEGASNKRLLTPFSLDGDDDLAARYDLDRPFILNVGNYRPHKNVRGLLKAYAQYRRLAGARALPLVIVGKKDRFHPQAEALIRMLDLALHVRCVGFVPDDDLPMFYRRARAFATLSLCEGFGLPVLEAMSAGTPVVAADRLSLPEVTGDAGLIVDPDDVDACARAIMMLAHDDEVHRRYSEAARERAKRFTWEHAARVTLDVYDELMQSRKEPRLAG